MYVEVIPRTLIVYFSKVVPCFFGIEMYYLAFFGLDWAFLGMGLVMRMRMGWIQVLRREKRVEE
jgi:hypothetical protein